MKMLSNLTAADLRQILRYDPDTGEWIALTRRSSHRRAGETLPKRKGKRKQLRINGKAYLGYRLAWLYMLGEWPLVQIDHIDGDLTNDCWDNLRPATQTLNNANSKKFRSNTSGVKGVVWSKHRRKWIAQISKNGKYSNLGSFDKIEAASKTYQEAATKLFGEYARYE